MISILIPIYNYNIDSLVSEVHKQLLASSLPFEIICMEDGSDLKQVGLNKKIITLQHTMHIILEKNVGRVKTRRLLVQEAQYDWLLFLDADVMPKSKTFIQKYIDYFKNGSDAVFGGICYHSYRPKQQYMLRWKYGILNEQNGATLRNQNPYKQIVSANMLIKKSVLTAINSEIKSDGYGMDNYLSALLKAKNIELIHIDNEVYHLGIDSNEMFLDKTKQAVENLLSLHQNGRITNSDNTLLNYFKSIKRLGLQKILATSFRLLKDRLEKNLMSSDPSINLFQYYKLGYICHLDLQK